LAEAIPNAFKTPVIAKKLNSIKDPVATVTKENFEASALEIFRLQAQNNPVYKKYISTLGTDVNSVSSIRQIPFMPISFFKDFKVITGDQEKIDIVFTSSGTTGAITSKHYVTDKSIYEKSYLKAFDHFYGSPEEYFILALLPSYLEREGSSLIYMMDDLIKKSRHPDSGFYLHELDELSKKLIRLNKAGQKIMLVGVTYALLDLIESHPELRKESWHNLIVMETGGMKGKRKEMVREELHSILCEGLNLKVIHSEYGMTELLSQAYSKGNGVFDCPPWMRILIRDTNDPFTYLPNGRSGGINVIDLANINSCSFIATQDLGKLHPDGSFEILGRFDNSDIRGCNLLVQ
jgi:phenylacetate-coenzyme A ligase PaaK-like adenylate-forming protein